MLYISWGFFQTQYVHRACLRNNKMGTYIIILMFNWYLYIDFRYPLSMLWVNTVYYSTIQSTCMHHLLCVITICSIRLGKFISNKCFSKLILSIFCYFYSLHSLIIDIIMITTSENTIHYTHYYRVFTYAYVVISYLSSIKTDI